MADNIKKIKLGLDYKDFTGSTAEINRQMSVLNSTFKVTSAEVERYGESTEVVRLEQELLQQKIILQNKLLENAKLKYNEASKAGNENSSSVVKAKNELNQCHLELIKFENQLENTTNKLENLDDSTLDVTRELELLEAQYRLASEEVKRNGSRVEALVLQQQKLQYQYKLQIQLVEEAEHKHKKAIETERAGGKSASDLEKAVLNLKTELQKTCNELADIDDRISDFGNASKEASDQVNPLAGSIVELESKLNLAGKAFEYIKKGASQFIDFDATFSKVLTIADLSVVSVKKLKDGVIRIAKDVKRPAEEIAEALYSTISANTETSRALEVTEQAAKLAKAGFTDTATAVDVLTTIMNAYGISVDEVSAISDKLIVTQNLGKTSVGEIATSFGDVAGLAYQAGVSLDEVLSVIATMTQINGNASKSITAMKAALSNIIKPTQEAEMTAKKLGIQFNVSSLQSKGFAEYMDMLKNATHGNLETMAKLFGSIDAVNELSVLTGVGFDTFNKSMEEMGSVAGNTESNLDILKGTGNNLKDSIINLQNTLVEIGKLVSPVVDIITGFFVVLSNIPTPIYAIFFAVTAMIGVLKILPGIIGAINLVKGAWTTVNAILSGSMITVSGASILTAGSIMKLAIAIAIVVALIGLLVGGAISVKNAMEDASKATQSLANTGADIGNITVQAQQKYSAIQYHAAGTENFTGGETWIGESGPELVRLPRGSQIVSNNDISKSGATNNYYITIDAKNVREFNDIIKLSREQRYQNRLGVNYG